MISTILEAQHNNQRLIILCVAILGTTCILSGTILTFKGYNAELLIGGGTAAIAGLLGVLSNRLTTPPQDVTLTAGPPAQASLTAAEPEPKPEVTQP